MGAVFEKVKPRLAVLSHYAPNANILPLMRKTYTGPFELGEDELTIDVGASIRVERFTPAAGGAGSTASLRTAQPSLAASPIRFCYRLGLKGLARRRKLAGGAPRTFLRLCDFEASGRPSAR